MTRPIRMILLLAGTILCLSVARGVPAIAMSLGYLMVFYLEAREWKRWR